LEGRQIVGVPEPSASPSKERYAVSNDSVFKLIQPGAFDNFPLTLLGRADEVIE
jgi:hypothetical protein